MREKSIVLVSYIYELKVPLKARFFFEHLLVTTLSNREYKKYFAMDEKMPRKIHGQKIPKHKIRTSEFGYLLIQGPEEVEPFESTLYASAKMRPQLLVVHGIISYLTGHALMAFQSFQGYNQVMAEHLRSEIAKTEFMVDEVDHSTDLLKIMNAISEAELEGKVLIFTLLERWRKALFLQEESQEVNIHIDEAVLAYFQILEVLADEYKGGLEWKLEMEKQALVEMLKQIPTNAFNYDGQIRKITNQLTDLKITARAKIMHMLEMMELANPKMEAFIKRYADYRNSIAHGRKNIYQDMMIYPLESVFSFIKDLDEIPGMIQMLSATVIAKHLKLDTYVFEWPMWLIYEQPPIAEVKKFIATKGYETMDRKKFFSQEMVCIIPKTLSHYAVRKKITLDQLEQSMKQALLEIKITKDNFGILFQCLVLLADSDNKELAGICQKNLEKALRLGWQLRSDFRDEIHYMEYHGFRLPWLRSFLSR